MAVRATSPVASADRPRVPGPAPGRRCGFGVTVLVLAAGLVANAVLGPLVTGAVDYGLSASLTNQLLGLEAVTLALVVPVCVVAGGLALRGHPAGPVLAIGPAGYALYMLVQYVLGPEYDRYHPVLLLHLGLAVLAGTVAARGWALALAGPLPGLDPGARRRRALVLLGLGGFVLLRYLPGLVGALTGAAIPAEFAASRTFYWSIWLLDLGVVVPVTVAAARALVRGTRAGELASYAVLGWFALVPASVAAMALVMLARDDPNASAGTAVLLTVAALAFTAVAAALIRPVLHVPAERD